MNQNKKAMVSTKQKPFGKGKKILALAVALGLVLAGLELTNTTHLLHKSAAVSKPAPVINKLPAKPLANNGEKQPSTSSSTLNKQTDTDKNGQTPAAASNDPSKWLVSQSGVITVKLPTAGSTFKTGNDLYGSAKGVGQVQYRLIDDQVGVISEGSVNVVDGNFTAAINFKSYAGSGRLDVFTADQDGRESNEVQVNVKF